MFFNYLSIFIGDFIDSSKRLYIPTIIFTLILSSVIIGFSSNKKNGLLKSTLLSKTIWTHPSSKIDIQLFIINNLLKFIAVSFFSGLLLSSYDISLWFLSILNNLFSSSSQGLSDNTFIQKCYYTLSSFIFLDFARFFQHYCMHKIPLLWKFHQAHHSAEVLTPLTVSRVHPIEMFLGIIRTTLVVSLSTSLFIYLFRVPVSGFEILGVNLFGFLFNLLGANLRHSHFWLSFGYFEFFFISPAQHQIHHSKNTSHFDKNFGIALSIWDRIFCTFLKSPQTKPINLKFGIDGVQSNDLKRIIKYGY